MITLYGDRKRIQAHAFRLSTLSIQRSKQASNAFNAMFVDTVDTGVCGSYATPYAGVKTLHKVASCPCQEGRLLCEPSVLRV